MSSIKDFEIEEKEQDALEKTTYLKFSGIDSSPQSKQYLKMIKTVHNGNNRFSRFVLAALIEKQDDVLIRAKELAATDIEYDRIASVKAAKKFIKKNDK